MDESVARELASYRGAGWMRKIKPGDSITEKIEEGRENFRVLVLFILANAIGMDWAELEFRQVRNAGASPPSRPLSNERRFPRRI